MGRQSLTIGILALQGAFIEHQTILARLKLTDISISSRLVKTPQDLEECDALIIPGGESTTIALLARLAGLLEPLKSFVKTKPVWGTCAGAILLSEAVEGTKKGGQELLGGISVRVERNGWGSQVESFEAPVNVTGLREPDRPFTGVFIRAPIVLDFIEDDSRLPIEILARLPCSLIPRNVAPNDTVVPCHRDVVALRQGYHLLTTFHPELTRDDRFHDYFIRICVAQV